MDKRLKKGLDFLNKEYPKMDINSKFEWIYEFGKKSGYLGEEISIEDVQKILEDIEFDKMISSKKLLPNVKSPEDPDNKISLYNECIGNECTCAPSREDCCIGEYGVGCSICMTVAQFNKMIGIS